MTAKKMISPFTVVAFLPLVFGGAYVVRCDSAAGTVEEITDCWKTGGLMAGISGGTLAGFNTPNPSLDKARRAIAEDLGEPPVAPAAPPPEPPEPPLEMAIEAIEEAAESPPIQLQQGEVLPPGWERDHNGRLHDEEGRYVAERR